MTREEAITTLKEMHESFDEIHENTNWGIGYEQMTALDMAIEALHREEAEEMGYCHRIMPSNVEVVVRCKDCKHYIVEGITTQYGWCHEYKHSVNEDDYCSYGERREE